MITLCVPSCNQDLFDSCAWHAAHYADKEPFDLVGLGNGVALRPDPCTVGFASHRIESLPDNVGVPAAMHELWLRARDKNGAGDDHVVLYLHDDLRIYEKGWVSRLQGLFDRQPAAVLAGFSGTEELGANFIYKRPYSAGQLSRQGPLLSNLELHAEFHGQRVTEDRRVAFVDGFSLAFRASFLERVGGWKWWPFELVHHAYDYGACCMARRYGGEVWLCPLRCDHGVPDKITHTRHAGTSATPAYKDLADKHGGDAEVHARAHKFVYEEFKDVLPIDVRAKR
jgi:hypothetical protein